jgi:hypothetical protein
MAVASFNNTSVEDDIESTHATYATAAESGSLALPAYTHNYVGQYAGYNVEQFFQSYDTSTLDDGVTVSGAVLSIYVQADSSATDFVIEAYAKNFGAAVDTGDWVAQSAISGLTLCATLSTASMGTGLKAMTSEAGMAGCVNKTGLTQFVFLSSKQRLGTAPTSTDEVAVYQHDVNASTLDVTYTFVFTGLTVTRLLNS